MKKSLLTAIALSLILTGCGQDQGSSQQKSAIKARQDLMRDWRSANDMIKGMAENPATFDGAVLKEQVAFIANSKDQMWQHFQDKTEGNKVNELISQNPAEFQKAVDEFNTALDELNNKSQTAQAIGDVEALIGKVNESCGSCHKVFKKK